jgi:hypothetical protein
MRFLAPDSQILPDGKSWITTNVVLQHMITDDSLIEQTSWSVMTRQPEAIGEETQLL